jgi:hypothetical protein
MLVVMLACLHVVCAKTSFDSDKTWGETILGKDLADFREENRHYVDIIGPWMSSSPRLPLAYIRTFDYDDVWRPAFHQHGGVPEGDSSGGGATGFWLGWVFCPELVVLFYATNFYVAHPIMAVYTCICCALRFVAMLSLGKKLAPNSSLAGYFMVGVAMDMSALGIFALNYMLWYIIPAFLCDVFFYMFFIFGPIGTIGTVNNFQAELQKLHNL